MIGTGSSLSDLFKPNSNPPQGDRTLIPGPAACPRCGARAGQYRRSPITDRLVCIECATTDACS